MSIWSFFGGPGAQQFEQAKQNVQAAADQMAVDHNAKQTDIQREFAQSGIQWRVEDARKAGIAPLAALGASTYQYQPHYISGSDAVTRDSSVSGAAKDVGNILLQGMGQNVLGPALRTATMSDRQVALENMQIQAAQLDLVHRDLQNQYLSSQIRQAGSGPAFPMESGNFIPGQGNSDGLVKVKPAERTASASSRPAQEAGWRPDVSFSRTDTGLAPMVPESLSESLEDDHIGKFQWRMRNQLIPNLSGGSQGKPAREMLPRGAYDWKWNYWKQEWQPKYGLRKNYK